jgi:hypothetical protein
MTAAERTAAKDREAAQAALERQRTVQNDLARNRINLSHDRFAFSQSVQDNRLQGQTRKELGEANKIAAQAEQYEKASQDIGSRTQYKDPQTGEIKESRKAQNQRDEYAGRASALRQQLFSNYGYLFSPSDGAPPQMSLDNFRRMFPNFSTRSSPAMEATRLGVTLTDADQGGAVPAPAIPRRGAPARPAPARGAAPPPAPSPQSTPRVSRARFRAKYPQFNG